ncbi:MAG: hypothetical protein CCU26_07765 [Nitrospira sp. UW-LDO-01]|nr:MAG: hypothetical protein CCU26_07765 [Nitrospira sp. UW-LDO-01]
MIDPSNLDQSLLDLPLHRIVQRLDHVDHHVLIGIPFVGQHIVVGQKGSSLCADASCVKPLDILFGLLQYGTTLLIFPRHLQDQPTVHPIEQSALCPVLILRLLHDRRSLLWMTGEQALFNQQITIDGRAASSREECEIAGQNYRDGKDPPPPHRSPVGKA